MTPVAILGDRPRLAVVSATLAPVSLVGGWTWAAAAQPGGFDAGNQTISALAAADIPHRWIMTLALLLTGAAHLVTASALPGARTAGRVTLGMGGVATLTVALLPLPSLRGSSAGHTTAATAAFVLLGLWPWLASRRTGAWGLHPLVARVAAVVLLALPAWLAARMLAGASGIGATERWAAGAQAVWPLVVALTAWWAAGRPVGSARFRHAAGFVGLLIACALAGAATTTLFPSSVQTRHYAADLHLSLLPSHTAQLQARTVFGDINLHFAGFAPGIDAQPQVKASIADVLSRPGISITSLEPGPLELQSAILHAAMGLALRFAVGSLLVIALAVLAYAGWHRRRRPSLRLVCIGFAAWLVSCLTTGVAVWQTYQPDHLIRFTSTGVLGTIQRNADLLSDVQARAEQTTPYLKNLLALSSALQDQYSPQSLGRPVALRVLLVSDIHGANQYPLMRTIVQQEHIDAVIDSGDLVNFGTVEEARAAKLVQGIASLKVPYLFVKGNHDAASPTGSALLDRLAEVPNVLLLQPSPDRYQEVTLHGIRIAGFNDPRWFGDDNRNNTARQQPAKDQFVRTFTDRLEQDVIVSHEPGAVRGIGLGGLLVNGHIHSDDLEGNRIGVGTFTGGGPFSHYISDGASEELRGQPSAFDIMTFGQDCRLTSLARYTFRNVIEGRPAYDDVSLLNGATIDKAPTGKAAARTCSPSEPLERTPVDAR